VAGISWDMLFFNHFFASCLSFLLSFLFLFFCEVFYFFLRLDYICGMQSFGGRNPANGSQAKVIEFDAGKLSSMKRDCVQFEQIRVKLCGRVGLFRHSFFRFRAKSE
jgi:hypothetical protein